MQSMPRDAPGSTVTPAVTAPATEAARGRTVPAVNTSRHGRLEQSEVVLFYLLRVCSLCCRALTDVAARNLFQLFASFVGPRICHRNYRLLPLHLPFSFSYGKQKMNPPLRLSSINILAYNYCCFLFIIILLLCVCVCVWKGWGGAGRILAMVVLVGRNGLLPL